MFEPVNTDFHTLNMVRNRFLCRNLFVLRSFCVATAPNCVITFKFVLKLTITQFYAVATQNLLNTNLIEHQNTFTYTL
jgi:hypothetical protein